MVVAAPLLEGRVAPRCTRATHLLLATVTRGRVRSWRVMQTEIGTASVFLDVLRRNAVEVLVCGGITPDDRALFEADGVDIIDNVACSAEEAVAAVDTGTLRRGFGLLEEPAPETGAPTVEPKSQSVPPPEETANRSPNGGIDCLACSDRVCLRGHPCPEVANGQPPTPSNEARRVLEAATDIALEPDRQLCRITELIYLCLELEYRRVGLAFCVDLLEPAQILAGVLRRFVEVVPVCCKIGGGEVAGLAEEGHSGSACNPLLQAAVLNRADTDLNIMVGLCIGADLVFTSASHAPVTALFVKDRSLANNPIGALYSEYYLQESISSGRLLGTSRSHANTHGGRNTDPLGREEA